MPNANIAKTDIFVIYNAAGASDFHSAIVDAIIAGGVLPDELSDLLTLTKVIVDGATRWRVDFA